MWYDSVLNGVGALTISLLAAFMVGEWHSRRFDPDRSGGIFWLTFGVLMLFHAFLAWF